MRMSIFRISVANTVQEWKGFNIMNRISPNIYMYVSYLGLEPDSSVVNFPLVGVKSGFSMIAVKIMKIISQKESTFLVFLLIKYATLKYKKLNYFLKF